MVKRSVKNTHNKRSNRWFSAAIYLDQVRKRWCLHGLVLMGHGAWGRSKTGAFNCI